MLGGDDGCEVFEKFLLVFGEWVGHRGLDLHFGAGVGNKGFGWLDMEGLLFGKLFGPF